MCQYSYYITPEQYKMAAMNGIDRQRVNQRVRDGGWEIERAIKEPKRKKLKEITKEQYKIAKSNGIGYHTVRTRVFKCDWSIEDAITKKVLNKEEQVKKMNKANRKYSKEILDTADKNGINRFTFYSRVNKGWDIELAATTPTIRR